MASDRVGVWFRRLFAYIAFALRLATASALRVSLPNLAPGRPLSRTLSRTTLRGGTPAATATAFDLGTYMCVAQASVTRRSHPPSPTPRPRSAGRRSAC